MVYKSLSSHHIGKFIQLAHKVREENIHDCRGVCLVNVEMVVALIPHEG